MVVVTMFDNRTVHSQGFFDALNAEYGNENGGRGTLARTTLRRTVKAQDANASHVAIGQYAPDELLADEVRRLARELTVRAQLGKTAASA